MRKPKKPISVSTGQAFKKASALKKIRWPLRLTWVGLLAEQLTTSFWQLWSVLFVLWAALSFGLQDLLNLEATYIVTLAFAVTLIWFLVVGVRSFHWPTQEQAIDRLDRSLTGRPLTALWDKQAIGRQDKASAEVWSAHVLRMEGEAAKAHTVRPDLRISRLDPFGLRYLTATALVTALLFGSINRSDGLIKTLDPNGNELVAQGPIFEGWIEPPRYTGLPTMYLNELAQNETITVAQNSKMILRLYGETGSIDVAETLSGGGVDPVAVSDVNGREFIIRESGSLSLTNAKKVAHTWQFKVIADLPPTITLAGPVTRTPRGTMELTFNAADDYGVTSGTVILTLDLPSVDRSYGLQAEPEPRAPVILDVPMPFTGNTKEFEDVLVEDLAKHPFAGLPALIHLQVLDAAGQTSDTAPEAIILPGRRFFDPLAAAVAEQRRDLLWNRSNALRVSQVLRAITNHPEDVFDNEKAYLVVRTALRRIEFNLDSGLSDSIRDDIAELLWRTALLIEEGDVSNAAERLRRAQERLSEALENGATDDEIAQLMDELRQATQDYLEALSRDAQQNPDRQSAENQQQQQITSDQLREMMDRIQELAKQGRNEEAQAMLQQLRQLMENIQTARGDPTQQGQGPGQQSMQDLQDTLRQQQNLSDEAFKQLQEDFNRGRQSGQSGQSGRNNPGGELNSADLARRQEALRRLLDQQRGQVPGGDTPEGRASREALDRAEREMGAARDALREGDTAQALDNQARALEALREGIQNLGEDLARNQSPSQGRQGNQAGTFDPDNQQDPLGRQAGTAGRIGSNENLLPGENIFRRSREIMDEIRRRSGDRSRPKIELDYLQRLLNRF